MKIINNDSGHPMVAMARSSNIVEPQITQGLLIADVNISTAPDNVSTSNYKNVNVTPKLDHARAYIKIIAGTTSSPVTFQTFDDFQESKNPLLARVFHGTIDELATVLTRLNFEGAGIAVMVNEGDGLGRSKKNVVKIRAFFLDLDGTSLDLIRNSSIKPHLIIETSPGHYHVYWKVEGVNLDEFEKIQTILALKFGGDNNVADLSRAMRLPSFVHQKGTPHVVTVVEGTPAKPYSKEEFLKALDIDLKESSGNNNSNNFESNPLLSSSLDEGSRHQILLSIGGLLKRKGLSSDDINTIFKSINESGFVTPQSEKEVANLGRDLAERYESVDEDYIWSEVGLSDLFVKRHGTNLIYSHEIGSWYFWDGKHWVRDTVGKALKLAKETIRDLIIRVKSDPQDENSGKRLKFLVRAETSAKFESILKLAKPDLAINTQLFDNDPYLLNVQNGTIDLRTGELFEHNKDNYQTKIAGTHYDPQAKCDLFESFLNTIFNGDSKLIAFLKRVLGYSLTGLNSEQCWFLLYGTGSNGKSTLVNIIRYIMGDYSSYTPADTFQLSFGDRIRNDLARLRGSRFISASEPDKTKKLDTELLKSFTGGESVTSRYLHKEFFEYNPTGKLFISANHYPSVNANDYGFWRRVKMIPFNITIPLEDRKKDFELKFRTESAGILRWMVEGCVEWFKEGLEPPESVIEATSGYRDDMDVLSDFLDAPRVDIGDKKFVKKIDLFSYYSNWLNEKGIRHLGQEEFNRAMTAKGFKMKQVGKQRMRSWEGIGLKPQS